MKFKKWTIEEIDKVCRKIINKIALTDVEEVMFHTFRIALLAGLLENE